MKYEFDPTKGKVSYSGVEAKRRDNAIFLRDTQLQFFDKLLKDVDPHGALVTLHGRIRTLVSGQADIEDLVISKKLAKNNYKNPQIHVNVNDEIKRRSPGDAYRLGERIPYLVIKRKGKKLYECGIDPRLYNSQPENFHIDLGYYYEKGLKKAMERLIVPLVGAQNAALFLQRARGGKADRFFKPNAAPWLPPLLTDKMEEEEEEEVKPPPAKRAKQSSIASFFAKK